MRGATLLELGEWFKEEQWKAFEKDKGKIL